MKIKSVAADRIEELEAALITIINMRPVKLADGLVSSAEELARDMQIVADKALEQMEKSEDKNK